MASRRTRSLGSLVSGWIDMTIWRPAAQLGLDLRWLERATACQP
ncbi:MAG: hypothetical protein ACJ742_05515 [Actinomycetes bacterium]|jgi:hypothetical protein